MKYLGQRNYPGVMLGKTQYTLGKYGCTTVAITMYYNWVFGKEFSPANIAARLEYNSDGMLLWESLSNVGLKLVSRIQGRADAVIAKTLKDPVQGCLIQVEGNHWVLGLSKALFGGYNMADPWTGKKGTTSNYKTITGEAIISKI